MWASADLYFVLTGTHCPCEQRNLFCVMIPINSLVAFTFVEDIIVYNSICEGRLPSIVDNFSSDCFSRFNCPDISRFGCKTVGSSQAFK